MTKSFKEIGKKAEALIEQGKEAEQKVQSCQARVDLSNNRVAVAKRQLAVASETNENGNPVGDVEYARAQLSMAENQLAASQRALLSAREEADRVRQQKDVHANQIESHNQIERANLEQLRRLRSGVFGADSATLTEGIVQRLNEAEDARIALLRSMGIETTPDYVNVGSEGGDDFGWRGSGFATIDTTWKAQSYTGGGSKGLFSGGGVATLIDGVLSPIVAIDESVMSENLDPSLLKNEATIDGLSVQNQKDVAKTRKIPDQQRYRMGLTYIDNIIDVYRYNLRDRGISDGEAMERNLAVIRADYLKILSGDIQNGTIALYNFPDPDFDVLADRIRADYTKYPPKYVIDDKKRETIREKIRNGIITEKEICSIGQNVREKYDQLILEKHRDYDEIRKEHFLLAQELKNATTKKEKEKIELRRKLLMERENDLSTKYNSAELMKSILSQYRDIGPKSETDVQPYYMNVLNFGSEKVINAIDKVRNYIPTDWVHKSNEKPIAVKHVLRGYFLPGNSSDVVALSGNSKNMESCAFHEMGHRFENSYPEILEIEKQFYERRTSGEQLSWLGLGYGKSEVTRFDNFISPYMGKDYGGTGYELLSMGMEGMFCETFNISRDSDYENLILGILVAI